MNSFYLQNILKYPYKVEGISTISVFMQLFQINAPLLAFIIIIKCVWDVSGCDTLFCVRRGGCGYRVCGVGSVNTHTHTRTHTRIHTRTHTRTHTHTHTHTRKQGTFKNQRQPWNCFSSLETALKNQRYEEKRPNGVGGLEDRRGDLSLIRGVGRPGPQGATAPNVL